MPSYKYEAVDLDGRSVRSQRDASDESQLRDMLRSERLYLVSCREYRKKEVSRRLSYMEISEFCRQMGSMLSAGITMVGALNILVQREVSENMGRIVRSLYRQVKLGNSLSDAMRYTDGAFPDLLISMVEAGEAGGNTEEVFTKMADHYMKEHKTLSNIKGAMTYPVILLLLLAAAIIAVFTFILPRFMTLFEGMELPLPTRIVMSISVFLRSKWYVMLAVIAVIAVLLRLLISFSRIRIILSRMLIRMGKLGRLFGIVYTARFCRTFSSLYASGLPVLNACHIARSTIGCAYIEYQFDDVIKDIRHGGTIADAIGRIEGFDPKLKSVIRIGEESGRLESMLESTADAYEFESEQSIRKITALIEPVMICIMGAIIAFVFVSVMLPIYSIYGSI
ncbi:MAG: type II secretion system F family protein [Huintestinicola sp.]